MLNLIDTQDKLKNFSEEQLIKEMQMPSGSAPQFLVLGEINRRQKMRQEAQRQQGVQQSTVAQDAVAAAGVPQGGLADMAGALAPKTDVSGNTGIAAAAEPQRMAEGGVVKMQAGGLSDAAYAMLENDPATIAMANRMGITTRQYLMTLSPEAVRANADRVVSGKENAGRVYDDTFDPNRPVYDQTTPDQLGETFTQMRNNIRDQEVMGMGVNPSFAYDTAMREYGMGISDVPMTAPAMDSMPSITSGVEARSPRAGGLGSLAEPVAADTAPQAPQGDMNFHEPSGMYYSEMDNDQLRILANAGNDTAANTLELRTQAPLEYGPPRRRPAPAEPTPGMQDMPGGTYQGETPEWIKNLFTSDAAPQIGGYEAVYPDQPAQADTSMPGFREPAAEPAAPDTPAAAPTVAETAAPTGIAAATTGGTSGGAGGSGGGAGGGAGRMSSYEEELMNILKSREASRDQDKWLALAEAGLSMMASKDPNFGVAAGEAGLRAAQTYRQSRDQYDTDRLAIMKAIEDARLARATLAARSASGSTRGALTANQMVDLAQNRVEDAQGRLDTLAMLGITDAASAMTAGRAGEYQQAVQDLSEARSIMGGIYGRVFPGTGGSSNVGSVAADISDSSAQ